MTGLGRHDTIISKGRVCMKKFLISCFLIRLLIIITAVVYIILNKCGIIEIKFFLEYILGICLIILVIAEFGYESYIKNNYHEINSRLWDKYSGRIDLFYLRFRKNLKDTALKRQLDSDPIAKYYVRNIKASVFNIVVVLILCIIWN